MHTVELHNPKILIRPNQAESTKEKNVVIGEPRSGKVKKVAEKKSPEASSQNSTLGGARSVQTGLETGLTGPFRSFGKISRNNKKKGRPSFKQLLAKYEDKGATQRQKEQSDQAKDAKPSSKSREQSASPLQQGNSTFAPYLFGEPVAP